jgi:hypothetical protein
MVKTLIAIKPIGAEAAAKRLIIRRSEAASFGFNQYCTTTRGWAVFHSSLDRNVKGFSNKRPP